MPINKSNWSGRLSTGSAAKRSNAAASPPRICGPMVRVNTPCQPTALAASNRKLPVVSAPVPPLPTMAMEMLGNAAMAKTPDLWGLLTQGSPNMHLGTTMRFFAFP